MNNKFYESFGHAKTRLRYHIIFSTKYRRNCLSMIRDIVLNAFRQAEMNSNISILEMEIDKDHIHFMIMIPPSISISDAIMHLKQQSTYLIYQNQYAQMHLKKFYWNKQLLWTHGYFCATIGAVSEETLRYYIENQG